MTFQLPPTKVDKISILGRESIHLGFHLIPYIAHTVVQTLPSSTYALVTDYNLAPLLLEEYTSTFQAAITALRPTARFISHTVPPGEETKSRDGKAAIEDWLLSQRATRDSVMIALGGGVVGDLVGFTAATFMRGLRLVQIPTTVLSMVDSAIGGKTAIDTPLGKNLIGAFHQPEYVFIDGSLLNTLPDREFTNGLAEIIKTAAIWDEKEFCQLESGASVIRSAVIESKNSNISFLGRDLDTRTDSQSLLLSSIASSIGIKSHIVTVDEKETGLRNLVNFGHTIGHAIEAVLTPHLLHGECVSIGMVLEAEVARSLGKLRNAAVGRLIRCLQAHGLPISLRDKRVSSISNSHELTIDKLMDIMSVDKKNSGSTKKIVILDRIGHTAEEKATAVEDHVVKRVLSDSLFVYPSSISSNFTLATPGSKSISNRALLLAYLAEGECRLTNLLHSDDTSVMIKALEALGGNSFEWENDGEVIIVRGCGGRLKPPPDGKSIYLGNAGTASRFLTTVCTLIQPTENTKATTITGNARMKERPIGPLVDALLDNGASIEYRETKGCLPLSIGATGLAGGHIKLSASISSQYVSSILLAAPYAKEPVVLELIGDKVISQTYIDITTAMMRSFGIDVKRLTDESGKLRNVYCIPKGTYKAPSVYHIESDASSATYPLALAAVTGRTCTVKNIGKKSLQGDARFAVEVLQPMGCKVIQTDTETTVTGPAVGCLKAIGAVDMEPMTDAFLTASVVAAVAPLPPTPKGSPITRIHGIANQRVKECNRIEAMRVQLAKFGVETTEHDDGLAIIGRHPQSLKSDASVFCYDDHRVAMSFAVLAAAAGGPGAIIEEKNCVEKTWPSFWDDIRTVCGIKVEAPDEVQMSSSGILKGFHAIGNPYGDNADDRSIIVIGMRGAGKTYSSKIGAAALVRPVIDADDYFSTFCGMGVRPYVNANGWAKFREVETSVLEEIMHRFPRGYIISLGGGVVETPKCRDLLKSYVTSGGKVVNVIRDIESIIEYLDLDPERPSLGEDLKQIYARRGPFFRECSTHELFSAVPSLSASEANLSSEELGDNIARFFRFITGIDKNQVQLPVNPKSGECQTFFLTLTYPDVRECRPHLNTLTAGVDAVELRVDLLVDAEHRQSFDTPAAKSDAMPSIAYVRQQVSWLKRHTNLPIIFTVRSKSQNGLFPDEANDEYFEMVDLAFRVGCEYVDIEVTKPVGLINKAIMNKRNTKIIASWHDAAATTSWTGSAIRGVYESALRFGDIVKLIGKSPVDADRSADIQSFREWSSRKSRSVPLIALDMGYPGRLSRILNPIFTPVTHPLLSKPGDSGQLSLADIHKALNLTGFLPSKRFFLFGTPISSSKSPAIHNTGHQALGLPHTYSLHETSSFDESIANLVKQPDFGGSSVTIPYKLDIMQLLDDTSPEAKLIGAVNTVVPKHVYDAQKKAMVKKLIGENTDWRAIRDVIHHNLKGISSKSTSLVIGAGGTCRAAVYALNNLGFQSIYLFNRSSANAQRIVDEFPASFNIIPITSMASEFFISAPVAIVSTIPAEGTTTESETHLNPQAGVTISPSIFNAATGGVAIDMAYKPKMTPFLRVAEQVSVGNAQRNEPGWVTVPGITMLIEQGLHQFQTWTGRKPPRRIIEKVVMTEYDREQQQLAA